MLYPVVCNGHAYKGLAGGVLLLNGGKDVGGCRSAVVQLASLHSSISQKPGCGIDQWSSIPLMVHGTYRSPIDGRD